MKKAIAYYRVSTDRQGQSGLGLEVQQSAVENFVSFNSYEVKQAFTEIESGKKNNRPELSKALDYCRKYKATLIIAKLDRLGRNMAFIANLMESGVEFKAVDNPHANKLLIHLLAAFAEHEREQISTRTKDALQAAKKRGVVLGKHGREVLSKKNKATAQAFALKMKPIIEQIKAEGFITYRQITEQLNARNIPTYRQKSFKWHLNSVFQLIQKFN